MTHAVQVQLKTMTPGPVDKTPHAHLWLQLSYSPHIQKHIYNTHSDISPVTFFLCLSQPIPVYTLSLCIDMVKITLITLTLFCSRGKKVAPEMMEPQGLEGKRCVLFDGLPELGHPGSVHCKVLGKT